MTTTTPRPIGRWLLRRTADAVLWMLIALGCGMSGLGGMAMLPPPWGRDEYGGRDYDGRRTDRTPDWDSR